MARRQERSIVEYYAEHERYRCGYCGGSDTNYSHGMWAHAMTVQDYQDLIDRGWRRSGKYCYKPTMNQTCCPQYTIRCQALNFRPSKSHKKVIKRVNRYLITGQKPGSHDADPDLSGSEGPGGDSFIQGKKSEMSLSGDDVKNDRTGTEGNEEQHREASTKKVKVEDAKSAESQKQTDAGDAPTSHSVFTQGAGPDSSKPPCRKAKQMRLERKMQKTGLSLEDIKAKAQNKKPEGKCLEDFLNEPLQAENPAHRLEIKLVRSSPQSEEFTATNASAHSVYHRYQTTVHKDPPQKPNMRQYTRFLVDSPLQIKLMRTSPTSAESKAVFKSSHQVFRKYQMGIHREKEHECAVESYRGFLVDSPLQPVIPKEGESGVPEGYGSFHQHYMLDGKLIAVGVVDILPSCVSSVYLYYDPEYSFLSLGTYSALRELAFVRELNKHDPALQYYYMGFYIHSCPKMRYKGQYYPSFLVCPEAYTWVPMERCVPKLNTSRYARLEEPGKTDPEKPESIDPVLVLHDREAMSYEVYRFMNKQANDEEEVKEYATYTGITVARRMLLFRK